MKKALAFVLLFALVFSGCAAKKETPRLQSSTSCPPLRQVNLYDAILDHAFIFEGECLSAESVESENDMDTLLEIRVDRVFKGELEEDGTVSVRTAVPALFPKEEKLVIFADVLEETEEGVCLYSNSALYSVYDRVNYGSGIFDVGTLSYDALCERIESYMQWTPTGDESETASEEAEEESVLLILWDPSPKREIELLGDDAQYIRTLFREHEMELRSTPSDNKPVATLRFGEDYLEMDSYPKEMLEYPKSRYLLGRVGEGYIRLFLDEAEIESLADILGRYVEAE